MLHYHKKNDVIICGLEEAKHRHSGDKTIPYKTTQDGDIYLSYYYPVEMIKESYPAIILIHGGCWTSHKIFEDQNGLWQGDHLGYLARYYADRGFISISVDYRLVSLAKTDTEHCLGDSYADCIAAINHILDNAAYCHIDLSQVYLLGESAGGHLAGMVATAYHRPGFAFKASFLVNAILNLPDDRRWSTYAPPDQVYDLSPLAKVNEQMGKVILLHGEDDTLVDTKHSYEFHEKAIAMGVPCELHVLRKTQHAFLLLEHTTDFQACKLGIHILNQYLST